MKVTHFKTPFLCVMPDLTQTGGVQTAGREAVAAIVEQVGETECSVLTHAVGGSRASTARRALLLRPARVVVVWHLNLLRVTPLVVGRHTRTVLFLHGIECWKQLSAVDRFLARRSDLIVSNSDYTWRRFAGLNGALSRHHHLTVNLGIGRPIQASVETETPPPLPRTIMLGRLDADEDYKGHREVIAAWPGVLAKMPDARLQIVGDGTLLPSLRALAETIGVSQAVDFYGHVDDETRDRLLKGARCLALPSRGEGFGLVYTEAMRVGRPCLVSTLDAGCEVVNPPEAGLAVDPAVPSELVSALCRLMSTSEEWIRWSRQARERYETRFTGQDFRGRFARAVLSGL